MARFGDVTCVVEGRTYTVRFGNLAWDELKRQFGAATEMGCLLKVHADRAKKDNATFFALLREGLATYHPDMTPTEAARLYDELPETDDPEQKSFRVAVWEAIAHSLPQLKKIATDRAADPNAAPAAPEAQTPKTRKRSSKQR